MIEHSFVYDAGFGPLARNATSTIAFNTPVSHFKEGNCTLHIFLGSQIHHEQHVHDCIQDLLTFATQNMVGDQQIDHQRSLSSFFHCYVYTCERCRNLVQLSSVEFQHLFPVFISHFQCYKNNEFRPKDRLAFFFLRLSFASIFLLKFNLK